MILEDLGKGKKCIRYGIACFKNILFLVFYFFLAVPASSQISVEEIGTISESVSNNATCEGFIDGKSYVFSFGGIDDTKLFSGIHLRSYRYDIDNDIAIQIPDLPDTLGKIAAGASRIGDIIYIIGGYHVLENDAEISSSKVHRYDIINNTYLSDGAEIPVPIDDQVQAVWNDSLIYVVTGWSNNGNVSNVQIYNPSLDSWTQGTPLPNNNEYFSFGSSGSIVGNTIYFYGGANGATFSPQFRIRKGIINPDNPTDIQWSISAPDFTKTGYRMGSTSVGDHIYWIGGSNNTYNYNGIAYDGSGGVSPNNRILYNDMDNIESDFEEIIVPEIPMDLRGIANVSDTKKYIIGGMLENQEVTNKVYEITIDPLSKLSNPIVDNKEISILPNPSNDYIQLRSSVTGDVTLTITNLTGVEMIKEKVNFSNSYRINIESFPIGFYSVFMDNGLSFYTTSFAVLR